MKKLINYFTFKTLSNLNLPKAKQFEWLESPIQFSRPKKQKSSPESELFSVKHSKIDLMTDIKTKNKYPLLILQTFPCFFNISNLVIQARALGFKSWVLKTRHKHGSQEEFEHAMSFINEKPPIIAFGNWINLIQNSQKLSHALVVRPKFNLEEVNKISEEANKKKKKDLQNLKEVQLEFKVKEATPVVYYNSIVPELDCKKPILIYSNKELDNYDVKLKHPVVFENKNWLNMEPYGDNEVLLLKLMLSFKDYVELG